MDEPTRIATEAIYREDEREHADYVRAVFSALEAAGYMPRTRIAAVREIILNHTETLEDAAAAIAEILALTETPSG